MTLRTSDYIICSAWSACDQADRQADVATSSFAGDLNALRGHLCKTLTHDEDKEMGGHAGLIATPKCAAARWQDNLPLSTADTTRSRISSEYGVPMPTGLSPSPDLESDVVPRREVLSGQHQLIPL